LKNDQTFVLLIHPSSRSSSSHSFERFKSSIIAKRSVCNWFAASLRLSGIFNIFFQDREHIEIRNIFSLRDDRNFVNSRAASELALSTAVDEAVMLCFSAARKWTGNRFLCERNQAIMLVSDGNMTWQNRSTSSKWMAPLSCAATAKSADRMEEFGAESPVAGPGVPAQDPLYPYSL